ncbi:TPA: hypothetical protein ACH3X1_007271 [Trebouxia sp. C0004]
MKMAGSGLAYQAEHKPVSSQAPDDLSFLTQIWMNHSNNSDRLNNGSFGGHTVKMPHVSSVPSSSAAQSSVLPSQNTLSASDAILNAGQIRKEPPARAAGLQSQAGDALLQSFSELPQQQSLKVNTAAQLAAGGSSTRNSQDTQRAQSPFWLTPPSHGAVNPQATSNPVTAAAAATTSTGVFLGNPAYGNFNTANANPQLYAQQLQGQPRSPLSETLHPKAAAQAAANAARAAAAFQQQRPSGASSASPFWVTTGQAGGANQPILNASPVPRFNSQVPYQQLHHLAANTGQRVPLHMQLNGTSHLSARPQAYSAGLANATCIPGTGLQYGGTAPHLHQRAPIPHHASDASYLQQDPQALAAAAAAAANAAVYKRTAGLPPHIQQQLLRSGQVLPNQAAPRPPNGLLFETSDIDLSGLTPAQLQMLISSPPEQVWRLAAQMGVFKQRRNGHASAPLRQAAPSSFVGNGSSASQANYINAMAHLHQLHGHHSQNSPQPASSLGQTLPDPFAHQVNGGLLQQQMLRQQQQQQQAQPQVTDAQRILLELGKTLAGLGITVEAAINAGLLGGLAVADVHTLCEAYAAEMQRMQLSGVQPQPQLASQIFGNQAALKPEINVADLLTRSGSGAGAATTNPAILAAARQQQQQQQALLASQMQGPVGLGRMAGLGGSDLGQLSPQDAEQLVLLRQLQLSGQLPANFGGASTGGPHSAVGLVSSAPGAGFRAPSPLAVGGHRAQSPAFGSSFAGGTVSPAYSTTSLPGGLGLHSRPGSAFGSASMGGGPITTDPVVRRPSPNPSMTSHASKQAAGSPRKSIQVANNTSPSSGPFTCASYSFFGSADSRNEHSIESPHSSDAWATKDGIAAKDGRAVDKSEHGSDSARSASERGASTKQGSDVDEAASAPSHGQTGLDEDLGVPTDEEILMSHLNLGPGF